MKLVNWKYNYLWEMETGFDGNQSADMNNTFIKLYGDKALPAFAGLSMVCSAWIIITNVFVLTCFVKHRKVLIKSTFMIQILTLGINDLIVGISILPVYVISFTAEITYEFCIFRLVLFVSAQAVVLFHILGICVYRYLTLRKATVPQRRRNQGHLILIYELVIWIVVLIFNTSVFLIWGKYRHTLRICSLNEILQNNFKTIIIYWVCLFIVPAVLTNFIYLAMIVRLCFYVRKIVPANSYNISAPQPSSSKCTNSYNFLVSSETNGSRIDSVARNDHSCMKATGEGKVTCNQQERHIWTSTPQHSKATNDTKTSDTIGEGKNDGRLEANSMSSGKSQKQALITIGESSTTFNLKAPSEIAEDVNF